jgi:collagenase-like PrtC family protease
MKVYYEEFGIDRFKITGRTALTSYVKWVIECYLSQQYNGNLLDLWQDVKNIQRLAQGKQEYLPTHYTIDCKIIDEEFIRWYFKNPVSLETEEQHIKSYFEKAFITR